MQGPLTIALMMPVVIGLLAGIYFLIQGNYTYGAALVSVAFVAGAGNLFVLRFLKNASNDLSAEESENDDV